MRVLEKKLNATIFFLRKPFLAFSVADYEEYSKQLRGSRNYLYSFGMSYMLGIGIVLRSHLDITQCSTSPEAPVYFPSMSD